MYYPYHPLLRLGVPFHVSRVLATLEGGNGTVSISGDYNDDGFADLVTEASNVGMQKIMLEQHASYGGDSWQFLSHLTGNAITTRKRGPPLLHRYLSGELAVPLHTRLVASEIGLALPLIPSTG